MRLARPLVVTILFFSLTIPTAAAEDLRAMFLDAMTLW